MMSLICLCGDLVCATYDLTFRKHFMISLESQEHELSNGVSVNTKYSLNDV